MTTKTDTYNALRQAFAKRILSSPLAASVGYPTDEHRLACLQGLADGSSERSSWTFLSVTFRRAGTNVDLSIDQNEDWGRLGRRTRDEEGNEWTEYTLAYKVNWPCHGSTPAAVALARVELYREVAMMAAELQAMAEGTRVWRMTATREEVVKMEEEQAKRMEEERRVALEARMMECIRKTCKGMRVGDERSADVSGEPLPTFPPDHRIDLAREEKTYVATAFGTTSFVYRRVR